MPSDWSHPFHLSGPVALFRCDIGEGCPVPLATARGWLSAPEAARAAGFRFARDADRFIRGRAFLRGLLAQRLGIDPSAVVLSATPRGKPYLAGPGPAFSLSHAGDHTIVALSDSHAVGADIEALHRLPADDTALADLVTLCCTPSEAEALLGQPDQRRRFLRFWTAKEARMKLTGEGMSLVPRRIALQHADGWPTGYLEDERGIIGLVCLDLPDQAISVASGPPDLHLLA
jgi:4'-phosphopantetheinyl transferase